MKHLYFLRHAKSDWGVAVSGDHERPLAPRGEEAAGLIGRFIAAIGQQPQLVVTSTAVRARTTAELAYEAGGWEAEIETSADLYGASPNDVLAIVRRQPDEVSRLLLVGHQPTWSESVGMLVGRAEVKMVTAAVARVDLPIETWDQAEFGRGILCWLVTPKLLAKASDRSS